MKRILSLITAAALMLSTTTAYAQENGEETVENITEPAQTNKSSESDANSESDFFWGINESGAVLTSYTGTDAEVTIPSEVAIDGTVREVVEISNRAFANNSEITSVYIPDGVKCIGANAFYWCTNLRSVRIPDSVTMIGTSAFDCCQKLLSIEIPNGVSEIYEHTFDNCLEMQSVIFPDNLKKIGVGAFSACFKLENITIPDSVDEIGNAAFYACTQLKSITVGKNVKKIGELAFSSNNSLETVKFLGDDFEMPISAIVQNDEHNFFAHKNIIIYANKNTDAEVAAKRLGFTFKTLDETESIDYSQVKGCTDVTLALYNAYSDFLTKHYIQKVPEAALEAFCCGDEEHNFFKTLTNEIIKDTPKEQIPEKLYNWMNKNIGYSGLQAGYPMDVYHYKSADCMGNAYLLCELLRCAEIPAVVAFGCGGDMRNTLAEYNVLFRNIDGSKIADHAWVFYYMNGKWNVADSALDNFISDIDEIAAHYYIFCVDGLALVTDYYTQIASKSYRPVDENGKFGNSIMVGSNECSSNNILVEPEGIFLNWYGDNKEFGQEEEWLGGSYTQKNGYQKIHSSKIIDDKNYWFAQNSFPYDITDVPVKTYFFGCPVLEVGDKFKLKVSYLFDDTEYIYSVQDLINGYWSTDESKIATIDSERTVTIIGEGASSIWNEGTSTPFEFYAYDPNHYKSVGLTDISNTSDSVTLSWNKVDEAINYVVKRLVNDVWIDVATLDGDTVFHEITGLDKGKEYTFGIDVIAPLAETGAFRFPTKDEITVTPGVKGETSFTYTDNDDGSITITGGRIYDSEVTIPDMIDGKKVTGIADNAFDRAPVMKTVIVPETVVFIGENALGFNASGDLIPDFKMKGYEDSTAQAYAIRYNIPFEVIGKTSAENLPFKDENKKEEVVETDINVSETVKPEDRITGITINPAFNMKNKDESGVGLDLTKIKVKAKEIYNEDGLKRAEEALGTELIANKHYNLLDLTLVMDSGKEETDISDKYAGLVEVTIPIPTGHRNKTFYCYRINDDGTKEIIPGIQTKDSYIVYLEHFSLYAFVADEPNETAPISVDIKIKAPDDVDTLNRKVVISRDGINDKLVEIKDGKFDISGIADGDYTFTFSANNCAPRAYDVTITDGAAIGLESGVKINLIGDINGDGSISLGDVLKANASARNSKPLTGYDKSVADINGDGKITLGDVLKMNAHARNSKRLW